MTPQLAQDLASYNSWMNARIYECAGQLNDSDRKRDVGAFFKSIHGTLNHILVGDKIWLGRFAGIPSSVASLDQELHVEFEALRSDRIETDKAISLFASGLTSDNLSTKLQYTSVVNPEARQYELWLVVAHFFNHQAHHRGQVTTLLSQAGQDVGVTDLIMSPEVIARNAT